MSDHVTTHSTLTTLLGARPPSIPEPAEPGGDRRHLQAANNLVDAWTRFVAVMVCAPGEPMLTVAGAAEVERRRAAA